MIMTRKQEQENKRSRSDEAADKARHRFRMRHDWHNLIDDLIEEGREQGVFDNLPGKGKPLNLKRNLYAPESELAHDLLRKNDLKPAWIAIRSTLLAQIEMLRSEIQRKWTRYDGEYRVVQGATQQQALIIGWDDTCLVWEAEIVELNKQIESFNLKRLSDNLELFKLNLAEELAKIGARRYLRQL